MVLNVCPGVPVPLEVHVVDAVMVVSAALDEASAVTVVAREETSVDGHKAIIAFKASKLVFCTRFLAENSLCLTTDCSFKAAVEGTAAVASSNSFGAATGNDCIC